MLIWITLLFTFFAVPKGLWTTWLLSGHPARGVLGMILLRFFPKTHEIAEDIELSDIKQEEMSVEKLTAKIKFDLSIQFMIKSQESRNWQLIYSAATALIYIFDILTFCLAFYEFQSVPGNEHADVIMLVMTLTYMAIDAYYFLWVMNLKNKLPPDMACFVSDAVLGYVKKMHRELAYNLEPAERKLIEDAKNRLSLK